MEIIIATGSLVLFDYLNIKGTGLTGHMQLIFAIVMVVALLILILFLGNQPGGWLSNVAPLFPSDKTAIAVILSIVAIAPWAYVGFDVIPQVAEEFNFPAKRAFILIVFALIFADIVYSLMILATSMGLPWEEVASVGHVWEIEVVI